MIYYINMSDIFHYLLARKEKIMYKDNDSVKQVVTVEDLIHILGIGRNTAYQLVRSGKIRSVKVGRTYRIPKAAVDEYLNAAS